MVTLRGWKGPTVNALPTVNYEAPKTYACPLGGGDRLQGQQALVGKY
jgi:hypothetical protein